MILTLLGGGGFRVPLVYRALMADRSAGRVTELRLHDVDDQRLTSIVKVLDELAAGRDDAPRVVVAPDLATALAGTDFIFSAMRVGCTEGRATDEAICLDHHIIGQETLGAGGISYALRGIPVALALAAAVREHAPDAWLINFTNPAGIITQVLRSELGERVVGICDSPVGLARRVLTTLQGAGLVRADAGPVGLGGSGVRMDYLGLNHLGWLQGLVVDDVDVLPLLLERADLVESFEEGKLFGFRLVQALGSVPNEYLHYFYFTREDLAIDLANDAPRGKFLAAQQGRFYEAVADLDGRPGAFELWNRTRLEREQTYMASNREAAGNFERDEADLETGGYDQVALAIMHAIANDVPATLVLNVPNAGTIPELADDDVIETVCRIDASGIVPLPVSPLPDHARGMVVNQKFVERSVISAARTGSRRDALLALLQHPLVDSFGVAEQVLDEMIATFGDELAYLR